jgi:DNA-binding IclR family transcriptional regulator
MRLHRARGYGALKAVLGVLADEEPLTLTEVAGRVQRTPGSTRDYLGWLEDVDLVRAQRKRYAFADPLLRVWVRLNTRCAGAGPARTMDEVQRYAVARLSAAPVTAR